MYVCLATIPSIFTSKNAAKEKRRRGEINWLNEWMDEWWRIHFFFPLTFAFAFARVREEGGKKKKKNSFVLAHANESTHSLIKMSTYVLHHHRERKRKRKLSRIKFRLSTKKNRSDDDEQQWVKSYLIEREKEEMEKKILSILTSPSEQTSQRRGEKENDDFLHCLSVCSTHGERLKCETNERILSFKLLSSHR